MGIVELARAGDKPGANQNEAAGPMFGREMPPACCVPPADMTGAAGPVTMLTASQAGGRATERVAAVQVQDAEASETMSERGSGQPPGADVPGPDSIKGAALSLLLGGGVCLYFGLTLIADAPASASPAAVQRWFAADNALFWCLRGIGVLFLVTAALAALGQRVSMLLATIAEAGFAVLMIAMTVEWTLEARADNTVNYQVILLLILAVVGASAAKSACSHWQAGRRSPRPPSQPDADHP